MDATDIAYVQRLLNTPWERHGFHCWRLVEQLQRDLFHREVPFGPVACPGRIKRTELLSQKAEDYGWCEVDRPEHGAVARMHYLGGNPHDLEHAGVYLALDRGYVIHTDQPHGTVLDTVRELGARGWIPRWFVPQN